MSVGGRRFVQANRFVTQVQVGFAILPSHRLSGRLVDIKKQQTLTAVGPGSRVLPPRKQTVAVICQQLVTDKIGPDHVSFRKRKQKRVQVSRQGVTRLGTEDSTDSVTFKNGQHDAQIGAKKIGNV